jgi:hypothetical protein
MAGNCLQCRQNHLTLFVPEYIISDDMRGIDRMAFLGWASSGFRTRGRSWLIVLILLSGGAPGAHAQAWPGHARDAQHTSLSSVPSQLPEVIRWQTAVDLDPQYSGSELLTHYGSPIITSANTVLVPVKTGAGGGFRLEARKGTTGALLWQTPTDYQLPDYNWVPPWGPALTPDDSAVALPAAGGTLIVRSSPDFPIGKLSRVAFFGIANYKQDPGAFNAAIQICTPVTSDLAGNLYFGYASSGAPLPGYPHGIPGGLARVTAQGTGSFIPAATLSGNPDYDKIVFNCAPAISEIRSTVYIAVNSSYASDGYLCSAATKNMTAKRSVLLIDPKNGGHALVDDDGTSTPTVGPDGDVYYGVLENALGSNHYRGWMLHFDSTLTITRTPGAFGWDITPSIVPSQAVPSYKGSSGYLILTKYNNYANAGGDGNNKVAVLDPNATEVDPISGATVMKEVITVLGPTKNPNLPGVNEWCINSAAIDPINRCAVVNSEDGHVYRWDFTTNTLSAGLRLADPTGEAYTPTLIGPDGAIYAVNNGFLNCCIQPPPRY